MLFNIVVIYGSVRSERQGIKAARFIVNQLKKRKYNAVLVDPKSSEHELPLLDKMYKEYGKGKAPKNLERLHNLFVKADGFIIVTGEYNHNVPPALSNLIDHFMPEYFFKPSGIVSYSSGIFSGVRAVMSLRNLLAEVGMPSISSTFPISKVQDSFSESGEDLTEKKDYERRSKKFLDEFEWYVKAFKAQRKKGTPY